MIDAPHNWTEYRTYLLGHPHEHSLMWRVQVVAGDKAVVAVPVLFEFGRGPTREEAMADAKLIVDEVLFEEEARIAEGSHPDEV